MRDFILHTVAFMRSCLSLLFLLCLQAPFFVQLSCVYRSMNESEVLDDARWHDELEVDDVWAADSDCGDSGEEDVDDADDVALAALYRAEHHSLYMKFMENKNVLTAAHYRNAFVHLAYRGLCAAEARINVPHVFKDLGYIDPSKVKLRIPFEFVPPPVPQQPVANGAQPKPKPKAKPVPRQLSITGFVRK